MADPPRVQPHDTTRHDPSNTMYLRALLTIFLSLAMLMPGAQAWAAVSAAEVESLACASGLCQQVDAMHQQMLDSLDELAEAKTPGLDAEVMQRLRRVADHAYASERMRGNVMQELRKRLQEKDLPALKRWYGSPVGQAIARAEQAQPGPTGRSLREDGLDELAKASEDRKMLLADILRESRMAESSVDIIINTTLAVRNGLRMSQPNAPGDDTQQLKQLLERRRPAMIQSFTDVGLPMLAGSYAQLSDDDLKSYLRFMKTKPGARFNESSIRAFEAALMIAASEFGQAIPGSRKGLNA